MATPTGKNQYFLPSKFVLKIAVCAAIVIYILGRLLIGSSTSDQGAVSFENFVDKKQQNLRVDSVDQSFKDAEADDPNAKSRFVPESKLIRVQAIWNFTEMQVKNKIYVMIPLANAKTNTNLQIKFRTCVTSISELSSAPVVLFIVGDEESRGVAETIVNALTRKNLQLHFVDVGTLGEEMKDTISTMRQHFSYKTKTGSNFSHTVFFLSIAIHQLAPPNLSRLIMLDADLKFNADIKLLHDLFDAFSPANVIGIAYENQPVHRHVLSSYRQSHPDTRIGDPPPEGLPGFNSGVLLLDLDRLRASKQYSQLLDPGVVKAMAEKYSYKGHLGDQDFYTLISLEHEDLFYVLPCTWNRQLCEHWRDKGYEKVFDSYFTCDGKVNVYHGNCNTPFPSD